MSTPSLVFVGGGPRTVSLLERIAANAAELLGSAGLDIHIIDPFPVGGGRIWRRNQSPLLWMNSVAKDVTIFTDDSVVCAGPIVPGPALDEWVFGPGRQVLIEAGLKAEADAFSPQDFASREIQSLYLSWVFDRVVHSLPSSVSVHVHQQRAVSVTDIVESTGVGAGPVARQRVGLADGAVLEADLVVLAQGYLDRTPTVAEARFAASAVFNDLSYIPPGYTADVDLTELRAGSTVLVKGFGLAFIDLMVLVGEQRGGRYLERPDGGLTYEPSGNEPILYVGSRRGVPYHAKLGYSLESSAPVPAVHFTTAAVGAIGKPGEPADFRIDLWPLIVKELADAHYRRLFEFHPERTVGPWSEFFDALSRLDVSGPDFRAIVSAAVPAPADRFDLGLIDRPLRGRTFADRHELSRALVDYVTGDLARRADPNFSPDHAVFNALLTVYGVLAWAIVSGRVSAQDRVQVFESEFHGLFSFLASGPPPRRLAEMLALHAAGLLHFAGPDLEVTVEHGRFVGRSPAVAGEIVADALVEARLPRPDVRAASDPIISSLLAAGQLAAEDLIAADGTSLGGGQLLADARSRAVAADRTVHPTRFLLGPAVSGSAGSAGFSRPGFNGPGLRQNDAVARELLTLATASSGSSATASLVEGPSGEVSAIPEQKRQVAVKRPPPSRPLPAVPANSSSHRAHPEPHAHERIETSHAR